MTGESWAIGIDLGGTKVEVAQVDATGRVLKHLRRPTNVQEGPLAVKSDIIATIRDLRKDVDSLPVGVGVGVAGQIDPVQGIVSFAPNLGWHNEPLQRDLSKALALPVIIINDVRAATWGEWLHGAGQGCEDLICLFVGTGIGGGIVSDGRMLSGCSNTAGELGHITIDLKGPRCNCGNNGCLEALAGGWAIARQAQVAISHDPKAGANILKIVEGAVERVTAKIVVQAAKGKDPLAMKLMREVTEALIAGITSLINAFNPCRLILGGGVIEGSPELLVEIDEGVRQRALPEAMKPLEILPAKLQNDAGVVGAAALAMRTFSSKKD